MEIHPANNESVVTNITSIGAGGGACTGACADIMQYFWSSSAGLISELAQEDAQSRYTSFQYNANGTISAVQFGGSNSTGGGAQRTAWLFYDPTFPGRLGEYRHPSSLALPKYSELCTSSSTGSSGDCALTDYYYGSAGSSAPYQLNSIVQSGTTENGSGSAVPYSYTTNYTFDTLGRIHEVLGPTGSETIYLYSTTAGNETDGYLTTVSRYTTATGSLTQTIGTRDIWGNAVTITEPD